MSKHNSWLVVAYETNNPLQMQELGAGDKVIVFVKLITLSR